MFNSIRKYGLKALDTVTSGFKMGEKTLGTISKYGHKVVDPLEHGINFVSKIPFVGSAAEPLLLPARAAVGVGRSALTVADTGATLLGKAAGGLQATKAAVRAGDVHQAASILRDTAKEGFGASKELQSSARSAMQKARRN